jgi:hypothetical protein
VLGDDFKCFILTVFVGRKMGKGKKRKMVTKKMIKATDKRIKSLQAGEEAEQQAKAEEEAGMQIRLDSLVSFCESCSQSFFLYLSFVFCFTVSVALLGLTFFFLFTRQQSSTISCSYVLQLQH